MIKNNRDEVPFAYYQDIYRKLDPKEVASRCAIKYNEDKGEFEMRYLGDDYFITFPNFTIIPKNGDKEKSYIANYKPSHILFIRYLIEGNNANFTNRFKSYRDFPWGEVYYRNFHGRCILRLTGIFGNRIDSYKSALEKIGATPLKESDCGYEFEFINNLYIKFLLWEGDEEFPPSMQILFSENFALAFSAEDMAVVGDIIISTFHKI